MSSEFEVPPPPAVAEQFTHDEDCVASYDDCITTTTASQEPAVADWWKPYKSIGNVSSRAIKSIQEHIMYSELRDWVATEKIHGTNFSLTMCYDGKVFAAKRSRVLVAGDQFHGWEDEVAKYVHVMRSLARQVACNVDAKKKSLFVSSSMTRSITVYGELCGGSFPGHAIVRQSIFPQMSYSPTVEFIVFDVLLHANGDLKEEYLDFDTMQQQCTAAGFRVVPVIARGPVDKLLTINVEGMKTRVPHLLGVLPEHVAATGKAEGIVIKPVKTVYQANGERYMLKLKQKAFAEVGSSSTSDVDPKVVHKDTTVTKGKTQIQTDIDLRFMDKYITVNLLETVLSKIGVEHASVHRKECVGKFTQAVLQAAEPEMIDIACHDLEKQVALEKQVKIQLRQKVQDTVDRYLEEWVKQQK
jgi:Rnl2 family RNA ligase